MIIVPIATPKGGAGKTTVSEMIAAGCQLGDRNFLVLDCDAGNRGYLRRCGKGSAMEVSWSVDPGTVDEFIANHLMGVDVVVLDFGANLLASGASILEFLALLFQKLRADGATVMTLAVASPNAPGTWHLVETIYRQFGSIGPAVVVENDVDGSGAFPAKLDELGIPRVRAEQLAAGMVAARLCRVEPLANLIQNPTPGYSRAMATYALRMHRFLSQPPLADVVGVQAIERLALAGRNAAIAINYRVDTLAAAHDDVLALNEKLYWAAHSLANCSEPDAWSAVTKYRTARAQYFARRDKK